MKQQRLLLLLIIGLFVISIGVGIFDAFTFQPAQPVTTSEEEGDSGNGNLTALTGIFDKFTGKKDKDGIAVVKVYGVIAMQQQASLFDIDTGGSDSIVKKIKHFRKNKHVKALVLRVNSPGGTIGASQEICAELAKVKEAGIPVVVSMGDLAASGGYYISAGADKIVANGGTMTGSIGVIIGNLNLDLKSVV